MNNIDVVEICKRFGVSYPKNVNRVIDIREALNIFKDNKSVFNHLLDKYSAMMSNNKEREIKRLKSDINNLREESRVHDEKRDQQIKVYDQELKDRDQQIKIYDQQNKLHREQINTRDQRIKAYEEQIKAHDEELRYRDQRINELTKIKGADKIIDTKYLLACFLIIVLIIICVVIAMIPVNNLKDARESEEYKFYDKYKLHKRYESIF